jgi:hypothetical protein
VVSELGRILELLHESGSRWRTLRAAGREWRHHARLSDAFRHSVPTGAGLSHSVTVSFRRTDGHSIGEEAEEPWRLWIDRAGRRRAEFAVGDEMVVAVFDGPTWWSWSPSEGARTNAGRANWAHGVGPAQVLVETPQLLSSLRFEVHGRAHLLDRDVFQVRATPRDTDDRLPNFVLHGLGAGADEYLMAVDAERDVLLRSEARRARLPFRVIETTEVAFDDDLPVEVFVIELPPGEEFDSTQPVRSVELADLPRQVPFTIWVPSDPAVHAHVTIHAANRRRGTALVVHIAHPSLAVQGTSHHLWLSESAQPLPWPPELPESHWHHHGLLLVCEDSTQGQLRCQARLQRGGTHVQLETSAPLKYLIAVAESLKPLLAA